MYPELDEKRNHFMVQIKRNWKINRLQFVQDELLYIVCVIQINDMEKGNQMKFDANRLNLSYNLRIL